MSGNLDSGPIDDDSVPIDDDVIDRFDRAFDEYRDETLRKSGLTELARTLPKDQLKLLEQFVTLPIFELVEYDGSKKYTTEFRQAVESLVKVCGYYHRIVLVLAREKAGLEQRLQKSERLGNIMIGVAVALCAVMIYVFAR